MELIRFIDVGRDKASWTERLKDISFKSLEESTRKNCRLASRDIDFDFNEEINKGCVFAGFRTVGHFEKVLTIAPERKGEL